MLNKVIKLRKNKAAKRQRQVNGITHTQCGPGGSGFWFLDSSDKSISSGVGIFYFEAAAASAQKAS